VAPSLTPPLLLRPRRDWGCSDETGWARRVGGGGRQGSGEAVGLRPAAVGRGRPEDGMEKRWGLLGWIGTRVSARGANLQRGQGQLPFLAAEADLADGRGRRAVPAVARDCTASRRAPLGLLGLLRLGLERMGRASS
jgi:hypothetical protein